VKYDLFNTWNQSINILPYPWLDKARIFKFKGNLELWKSLKKVEKGQKGPPPIYQSGWLIADPPTPSPKNKLDFSPGLVRRGRILLPRGWRWCGGRSASRSWTPRECWKKVALRLIWPKSWHVLLNTMFFH
jgi:hypothetical protein